MKVLKVIVAATMLFAAQKASAVVDVSAFGGYTILGPATVNLGLDTKISSGYYAGVDAGWSVLPFLKVGPRFEYLASGEGKVDLGTFFGTPWNYTESFSLMMFEGGASYSYEIPGSQFTVGGGAWLGYGMLTDSTTLNFLGTSTAAAGTASGFVSEIEGNASYKIVPTVSVCVDLGYRLASIAAVDLSGINIGGRVTFGF